MPGRYAHHVIVKDKAADTALREFIRLDAVDRRHELYSLGHASDPSPEAGVAAAGRRASPATPESQSHATCAVNRKTLARTARSDSWGLLLRPGFTSDPVVDRDLAKQRDGPGCIGRGSPWRIASPPTHKIYELVVELEDITPVIWRRLLVPALMTIAELHDLPQLAMGWTGNAAARDLDDLKILSEGRVTLETALGERGREFL